MTTIPQLGVEPVIDPDGMVLHGQIYVPATGRQGFAFPRGVDYAADSTNAGYADLAIQPGHPATPWKGSNQAGTGASTQTLTIAGGGANTLTMVQGVILIAFGAAAVWTAKFAFAGWDGITTAYVSPTVSGAEKTYVLPLYWPIQGSAVNTTFTITITNNAGGNFAGTVQADAWGFYRAV